MVIGVEFLSTIFINPDMYKYKEIERGYDEHH